MYYVYAVKCHLIFIPVEVVVLEMLLLLVYASFIVICFTELDRFFSESCSL